MQRPVILHTLDPLMQLDPVVSVSALHSVLWVQAHDIDVEPCHHELRVLQSIGEGGLIDLRVFTQLLVGCVKSYPARLGVKFDDVGRFIFVGCDQEG